MSDTVLKLIPKEPGFVPDRFLHESAAELLHQLLESGEMWQSEIYDHITFIDQGENIQDIVCPACRKRNRIDDEIVSDWWDSVCEDAEETGWEIKTLSPCCNTEINVTDLVFYREGGFAKYELSIWNPGTDYPLNTEIVKALEKHLQCELKVIWAHY